MEHLHTILIIVIVYGKYMQIYAHIAKFTKIFIITSVQGTSLIKEYHISSSISFLFNEKYNNLRNLQTTARAQAWMQKKIHIHPYGQFKLFC